MNYLTFCLFILFIKTARCGPIDYSNCGSNYEIKGLDLEGCNLIPCKLEIGVSYRMNMTLRSTYVSNSLTQEVYVNFYEVYLDLGVSPSNPCASLQCPVHIKDNIVFSSLVMASKNLVSGRAELWWKLWSDNGNLAVCIKTPVILVKPK